MEKKTVCFSDYRPEKMPQHGDEMTHEIELIKYRLNQAIQDAIVEQRRHFIVGMAQG